jgi:hypothetical protein
MIAVEHGSARGRNPSAQNKKNSNAIIIIIIYFCFCMFPPLFSLGI